MTTPRHRVYPPPLLADDWPFQNRTHSGDAGVEDNIVIVPPNPDPRQYDGSDQHVSSATVFGITNSDVLVPDVMLDQEQLRVRFAAPFQGVRLLGSISLKTSRHTDEADPKGVLISSDSTLLDGTTPIAEGSTSLADSSATEQALDVSFDSLFDSAEDETFFDGEDGPFNQGIALAIEVYGQVAVRSFHKALMSHPQSAEVVEEALRSIGLIEDVRTHHSRLAILISALDSQNPRTRDAASVGIASMDDPAAIPSIERALHRETSVQLKESFRSTLMQLRETNDDLIAANQKRALVGAV